MIDQVQPQSGQPVQILPTGQILRDSPRQSWLSRGGWFRLAFGVVLLSVVLTGWFLATADEAHTFLLASPQSVVAEAQSAVADGTLLKHLWATVQEVALGFLLGVSVAMVLGYGIAKSRLLEQTVGPYLIGFQAVPIVAIAPALIVYFGPGLATNAIICALIVFFPMLVTTIVGIRNIHPDLRDTMRSLSASRWQTFTKLEIPAALPILFGGFKVSVTLAVAGAVVGEAVNPKAGIGFLIYSAFYVFKPARVLVGIFTLVALALCLYYIVVFTERRLLRGRRQR